MKREDAVRIYWENEFDELIARFRDEFKALTFDCPDCLDAVLSDENIREHIISRIMLRERLIELNGKHPERLPYYVGKDCRSFITLAPAGYDSAVCASLKRDVKCFEVKGRTMFAKGRCSLDEACNIIMNNRSELAPIIRQTVYRVIEDVPDSPEKSAVIPDGAGDCACYAIMFSPAGLSPKEAIEQYLYDEIVNEIRRLEP